MKKCKCCNREFTTSTSSSYQDKICSESCRIVHNTNYQSEISEAINKIYQRYWG